MSAFRLQFGGGATPRGIARPCATDASHLDVPALRAHAGGPTDVSRRDVSGLRVHFDVIAARHGNLKLYPELRVSGPRRLRRKRAGDFHTRID